MKFLLVSITIFGYAMTVLPVYGALLKIESEFSTVRVGDLLTVKVSIDTQNQTLNAVETNILYPSNLLEFISSDAGDSVVTVWLRNTKVTTAGIVSFAGITPGGFVQDNASIVNLTFKVLQQGQGSIEAQNSQFLLHDGMGTQANIEIQNVHIAVVEGESTIQQTVYRDDEVPELFTPTIERDPDVFDGDAFLVFSTLDKNSGLSHFEVKEGYFGRYRDAESPYKIKHQSLDRNIFVKAIDRNTNERIAVVYAQQSIIWYENKKIIGSILGLCVLLLLGLITHRTLRYLQSQ